MPYDPHIDPALDRYLDALDRDSRCADTLETLQEEARRALAYGIDAALASTDLDVRAAHVAAALDLVLPGSSCLALASHPDRRDERDERRALCAGLAGAILDALHDAARPVALHT